MSLGSVQVGSVPIISNQKVNVDSHVLSQDVDMHAPPIIFRNQDTNEIPITSGTYANHHEEQQQQLLTNVFNRSNDQSYYHHNLPVGNLIRDNNRSPFVVDIQSINFGMSNEGVDSSISGEISDENAPLHSQAPSINDQIIDRHKEDDYENEHGEVIQESNAVPQLVSSDQSFSDNLNQIPNYTKSTTKPEYRDPKIPFTQTEVNSLWDNYQSTSELYPVTFTTERPLVSHTPGYMQTTSANRQPFGTHQLKLQIPAVAPALVNDMYAPTLNRTQAAKPAIPPTRAPTLVSRNPNNKQVFYGHQPVEPRPSKFGSIGTPHHITLQNRPVPPHFVGPLFSEPHRHHHSRRPISINQKPFSRYPVHYNKQIPTNYSHPPHGEPITPNRHSKPFGVVHFGPNAPLTTTRQPTSTMNDQTPQTSEIQAISTHRPFSKPSIRPDPESTITHYTDPSTNITQEALDSDLYDLSRGKPFVYSPQRPTASDSSSNLNIGEEKRPMPNVKYNNTGELKPSVEILQADIFDYKESNNPHNFAAITEPNQIETTDILPGITNAALVPFGEKIKVSNPIVLSEQVYPKTPATEMQPPPTHTTKYKPYIQNKPLQSNSPPPSHHQNVLIEEVMGLHPPPIPKLSVKQKLPSEIHGNYGQVSHNQHAVHKPGQGIFSITAPTHYPETPAFVTHHDIYADAHDISTEAADMVQPQIVTNAPDPDVDSDSDTDENMRIPYKNVFRDRPTTKETTRIPETTTTISDLDDYVRYSIDSNPELPSITTRKPTKLPPRMPSNGHMPQSPQFDESSLLEPSQQHIFTEDTAQVSHSTPTTALPAETIKATRHTVHDTKFLTVTTTKTTVRSRGITSTILLTLTRTKTSTILDTVTHTLVKPTRVTHEPSIEPTIFTAPITMQKMSGSMSSIIPNPSYSIYAIADPHDESEDEHDSSNNSSEDDSLDFDSIRDIQHMISPTPKIPEKSPTKHATGSVNSTNDSIFVVMTDRKKLGTININADLLHTLTSSLHNTSRKVGHGHDGKTSDAHKNLGPIDDVSTDDEDDVKRDEDDNINDVSHVLLGGILIASPPKSEVSKGHSAKPPKNSLPATYDTNPADEIDEHIESQGAAIIEETRTTHRDKSKAQLECQPDCKAVNNEICQITGDLARCVCRPGFARMFLDRPCKRKS